MALSTTEVEQSTIRVLLIEDYTLIRLGLQSVLNADPRIQVVGDAENGETGLVLIKQLRPDVVVLDLGLPGMNGIEVAREIKAWDPGTKIIILTSHEAEEEVLAGLSAGANAYCLKEVSSERLIEIIVSVQEGAAWLDPMIASVAMDLFSTGQYKKKDHAPEGGEAFGLTDRECQVLSLLVDGRSNMEIAAELNVSVHTSKAHVGNILQKLSVNDRVQAAVKAFTERLV
jgi:NarL family two-component system response regulator LiaR